MFDYYGIDPKTPVDTVPLSQLPAFIRDAKKAFTATFISGAEFEAGTVFGDAVFYDVDTQKWRRSVWVKGSKFNVDGFAIPQYQGVSTGALVHGSWMFPGGTELYLSATTPGKIFPIGTSGVPTEEEGAFLVGKQITPGVILFMPGVGTVKAYAEAAEQSAELAKESELAAKASEEAVEGMQTEIVEAIAAGKIEIAEAVEAGRVDIAEIVAKGTDDIIIVVEDGITTIKNIAEQTEIRITEIAEQTITYIKVVSDEQLIIIRNAGAVARRALEIVAEQTIISVRAFVMEAQEAAGRAATQAGLAIASRNAAEIAAQEALEAKNRMQSLKVTAEEGSDPAASYIGSSNTIAFTLPRGADGLQGTPGPIGDKGPQGAMGSVPFGAAFGKMEVADGMLTLEYADLAGTITEDTFTLSPDGDLLVTDGTGIPSGYPLATQTTVGIVRGSDTVTIDTEGAMHVVGGGGGSGGVGPIGPAGPQGIQGIQGEQGIAGPVGPKGDTGETGPQGPAGSGGSGSGGEAGPAGPVGPQGATGEQGIQGLTGEKGDKGDKGDTGEQGIQGPKGEKGDKGAAGGGGGTIDPEIIGRLSAVEELSAEQSVAVATLETGLTDVVAGVAEISPLVTQHEATLVDIDTRVAEVEEGLTKPATSSTLGLVRGSESVTIAEDGRAFVVVGGVTGNGVFVGQWGFFRQNPLPPGYHALDGTVHTGVTAKFPDLIAYLTARADELTTESNWQALSAAASGKGGVPFYVYNSVADTLRMPDTRGDSPYHGTVGTWEGDAIRNITGDISSAGAGTLPVYYDTQATGALTVRLFANAPAGALSASQKWGSLGMDTSLSVPTDSTNHPRRLGLTMAVYVGATGA